ncbi:MAG: SpoIIE family protein phosphatase [Bacteroidales bacterium]|nr:SpoIIE family protein phosphatase [Bacteroidales bacterium]
MRAVTVVAIINLFFNLQLLYSQKLPLDNYNINDGLPSDFVWDIEQDNKGFMWFATQLGVARFDGYRFENFGIDKGLPSNDVRCIYSDSKGYVWFGTHGGGLSRYNNYDFTNFFKEEGLCNDEIDIIFEDPEGGIWATSIQDNSSGISRIYGDSVVNHSKSTGLNNHFVLCHHTDKDNRIWFGTRGGYIVFSVSGSKSRIIRIGLENEIIRSITQDDENNIWIGTQGGGIYKYIEESGNTDMIPNPFSDIILSAAFDTKGNMWFGTYGNGAFKLDLRSNEFKLIENTEGQIITDIIPDRSNRIWMIAFREGIYLVEDESLQYLKTLNNLPDNSVNAIEVDNEGNVWFATISGISKYGKKPFEIYTEEFGLPQKEILTILADTKGKIWIGTYNGLARLDPVNNTIINYDIKNPFSPDIFSIYEDKEDNIWLGTYLGLTRYSNGRFDLIRDTIWYTEGEANNFALDILEDFSNDLWIAHSFGLCRYSGNRFVNYTVNDGLPSDQTRALAIDRNGNIWIATSDGVAIFDGEKFNILDNTKGLSNNACNDICTDDDNRIWVATENGLNRITWDNGLKDITSFTTSNGLASNSILFVGVDHTSQLWIGHGNGLNKMDLETYTVTYYGDTEGFIPLETYVRSVSIDRQNNVWIGTGDGLVKYNHKLDTISDIKPETYITRVTFYNDTSDIFSYSSGIDSITGLPESLVLPYNKCNLVFEYVGIHFALPEKNRYQYMLKGYDDQWSEITTKTSTEPLRKIPHGNYTFMLRAANSDGIWTDEPVTFSFVIKPPFWQTPLAYVIEVLLVLAILYLVVRLRERKLQQDKKILAQKVKERTIEIEKQRDQIAFQNKEITSSIMYAKRIQSAVLPTEEFLKKLLPQHFILFKPRDIVSGDFYWITEKDRKIILVAADCTGHGVPGAFMSMLGVSLLNEIISNEDQLSACDILNKLRNNVKKTLSQKGRQEETKDGMDLVLCILDFSKKKLQFAGAYNSLWLLRDNELVIYKGDKMPIGIYVGTEKPFTCQDIDLKENDLIYLFSDGYADQFGGPEEKKFKSGNLKELLLTIHRKPLAEQKEILDRTIEEWKGDLQQIDDIMVVGVKV